MKKIILLALSFISILVISFLTYIRYALPNVGQAPELSIELSPERIARGEYIAKHIAVCIDCHSERDWSKFSGSMLKGTEGKGGEHFGEESGVLGDYFSKNITPANLSNWTDGELFRAITSGVDQQGKALHPIMPYLYYGKMDKEDIYDIIAYIRSLQPINHEVTASKSSFPMNFIINTLPTKASFPQKPDKTNKIEYGKYLTNVAACMECHTPDKNGQILPEKAYSGGRAFKLNGGIVRSSNITPDKETGIGLWTDSMFVNRFQSFADS
ncbi:MAG: cytochrome c [Crocinitomicaceae bacterium]|nr:cytochrome c [Crocinitomicaceae bacterium]